MEIGKYTKILVIGGGPAGTTASTLLAREGFGVTLLELEHFPRYHIGESLIVSVQPILDLLGVRKEIEDHGFKKKKGVFWEWGNERWLFDWENLEYDHSYHVKREEFDHVLLKNAAANGVKVFEGIKVDSIKFVGAQPVSAAWSEVGSDEAGEITFDYLIDASGRAGVMANQYLKSIKYMEAFQNVAIWGYWKNATIPSVGIEGPLTVGSIPEGWLWGIPLRDETMSIGLVMHKNLFKENKKTFSIKEIYENGISHSALFKSITAPAELISSVRVETDYSYLSDQLTGPGYFIIGDAGCFIDPLLSSGVHLAMHSALLAAASLSSIIKQEVSEKAATQFYERSYKGHFFRWALLVSAFYDVNKSKENYFWIAQRLTPQEVGSLGIQKLDMKQIFATLVSGVIDFQEVQNSEAADNTNKGVSNCLNSEEEINISQSLEASSSRIFEYLDRVKQRDPLAASQRYHKGGRETFALGLNSDSTVNNMYVVTEPSIGLANVEALDLAEA